MLPGGAGVTLRLVKNTYCVKKVSAKTAKTWSPTFGSETRQSQIVEQSIEQI